jgi:hypothetical protein
VFWAFLLKTSRLFQNDLQVVMCLIIKALIVRTFSEFFSIAWLPNRQKNSSARRRFFRLSHTSHLSVFRWTIRPSEACMRNVRKTDAKQWIRATNRAFALRA